MRHRDGFVISLLPAIAIACGSMPGESGKGAGGTPIAISRGTGGKGSASNGGGGSGADGGSRSAGGARGTGGSRTTGGGRGDGGHVGAGGHPGSGGIADPGSADSGADSSGSGGSAFRRGCPLPAYPDASCTGVPSGTSLTVVNGDLDIKSASTVIDGRDIRGCVTVAAPGVVIRNSKVSCASFIVIGSFAGSYSGAGLLVEDSEIDCQS